MADLILTFWAFCDPDGTMPAYRLRKILDQSERVGAGDDPVIDLHMTPFPEGFPDGRKWVTPFPEGFPDGRKWALAVRIESW